MQHEPWKKHFCMTQNTFNFSVWSVTKSFGERQNTRSRRSIDVTFWIFALCNFVLWQTVCTLHFAVPMILCLNVLISISNVLLYNTWKLQWTSVTICKLHGNPPPTHPLPWRSCSLLWFHKCGCVNINKLGCILNTFLNTVQGQLTLSLLNVSCYTVCLRAMKFSIFLNPQMWRSQIKMNFS